MATVQIAAAKGIMHLSVIRILLEAGAVASIPNKNNVTAMAMICKSSQMVRHPKLAPLIQKYKKKQRSKKKVSTRFATGQSSLKM